MAWNMTLDNGIIIIPNTSQNSLPNKHELFKKYITKITPSQIFIKKPPALFKIFQFPNIVLLIL